MSFEILTANQLIERLKGKTYDYSQIHHTWKPNHSDFNGKNHLALQQGMYNYHVHTRGWDNIGQHATLMPDGKFVTGRPFNSTPAGISGYNTGAFMIEMLGDFDEGKDKLEGVQLEAMLKVQNYLITECGASIMFHCEHAPKTCPGTGLNKADFVSQVKNYNSNKDTKPVPTPVQPITTRQPEPSKLTYKRLLKLGSKGADVGELQGALNKLNFKCGKIDNDYGKVTKDAVTRFQKIHLPYEVDGIAGKHTIEMINSLL